MKFIKALLITIIFLSVLTGCQDRAEPVPIPSPTEPLLIEAAEPVSEPLQAAEEPQADYTFIWMSDTQHYSESVPHIFYSMTNWIADNAEKLNIKYVFHTGDLVQHNTKPQEWDVADFAFKALDDKVPFIIAPGNHDVGGSDSNYEYYLERFGPDRFKRISKHGGFYKGGKGSYDAVTIDGTDYIFMAIGWGCVNSSGIEWMNGVLEQYSDHHAILLVHDYITTEGLLSDAGKALYEKVVKPNPNVFLVLCGHRYNSSLIICDIDEDGDNRSDRTVYQKLGNYQAFENGGNGYLNIISVNMRESTFKIEAYSPYLDDYYYFDPETHINKDSVVLPVDIFH